MHANKLPPLSCCACKSCICQVVETRPKNGVFPMFWASFIAKTEQTLEKFRLGNPKTAVKIKALFQDEIYAKKNQKIHA